VQNTAQIKKELCPSLALWLLLPSAVLPSLAQLRCFASASPWLCHGSGRRSWSRAGEYPRPTLRYPPPLVPPIAPKTTFNAITSLWGTAALKERQSSPKGPAQAHESLPCPSLLREYAQREGKYLSTALAQNTADGVC